MFICPLGTEIFYIMSETKNPTTNPVTGDRKDPRNNNYYTVPGKDYVKGRDGKYYRLKKDGSAVLIKGNPDNPYVDMDNSDWLPDDIDKYPEYYQKMFRNNPYIFALQNFHWNKLQSYEKNIARLNELRTQARKYYLDQLADYETYRRTQPGVDAANKVSAGYNISLADGSSAPSPSETSVGDIDISAIGPESISDIETPLGIAGSVMSNAMSALSGFTSFAKDFASFQTMFLEQDAKELANIKEALSIADDLGGRDTDASSVISDTIIGQLRQDKRIGKYFKAGASTKSKAEGIKGSEEIAKNDIDRAIAEEEHELTLPFASSIAQYFSDAHVLEAEEKKFKAKYNRDYFEKADGKEAASSFNQKNIYDRNFWLNRKGKNAAEALNKLDELQITRNGTDEKFESLINDELLKMLNKGGWKNQLIALMGYVAIKYASKKIM